MRSFAFIFALLLISAPLLRAGDSAPSSSRKLAQAAKAKPGKAKPGQIDAKAEADVLEFVGEHHPELAELLAQLKDNHPKEYQKAVQDLSRVRQRLHSMKKNDDRRYELELSIWKAETRIQLLAARLQMGGNAELRDQLRTALNEQTDLRLALLEHEREQAKERVRRLEAQIKRLDNDRSQAVERQLQALTKSSAAGSKKGEKPAKNPPANKPRSDKPAAKPSNKP